MNYERPHPAYCTYPPALDRDWKKPFDEILMTIGERPSAWDKATKRFIPGQLRESYRLVNKIMQYNLSPFSNEKRPSRKDGELMYAIGSGEETVDWAVFIWDQLRIFRSTRGSKFNLPFPAMITTICMESGCKVKDDPLVAGDLGPINSASLKKSKSLSARPSLGTASTSRPTSKKAVERNDQWMDIVNSRLEVVMKRNKAVHLEQSRVNERNEQRQGKIMRLLRWVVDKISCTTEFQYDGPESDLVSSEEEGEGEEEEEEEEEGEGEEAEDEDDDDDGASEEGDA